MSSTATAAHKAAAAGKQDGEATGTAGAKKPQATAPSEGTQMGAASRKAAARGRKKAELAPEPAEAEAAVMGGAGAQAAAEAEDTPIKASPKKRGGSRAQRAGPSKRGATAKAAAADAGAEGAEGAAGDPEGVAGAEGEAAGAEAGPAKKRARTKKAPEPAGPVYEVSMRPPAHEGPATRIMSWNVAGLRAVLRKDSRALVKLVERERPDIICLQETKLQAHMVDELQGQLGLPDWSATWTCSTAKAGYSGVVTLCRTQPLSCSVGIGKPEHDDEGRVVTTEHERFWLVNAYVPNSGEGLKRLDYRTGEWDLALSAYCKALEARGKPVILTGDLNCAHREIDIHSPKTNLKSAGFTPQERESFTKCYMEQGFVDTFRAQYPDVVAYTYYSHRFNARATNRGWRLDYFLVSESLAPLCYDSFLLKDVEGSDHIPLGLVLKTG